MRACCIIFIFISVLHTYATYQNITVNLSCSGHLFEGGSYQTIGSIQPMGGSILTGGNYVNYSGSSSGFILQSLSSKNGISDEWSFDNDQDSLNDQEEYFFGSNLNEADSDNDNLTDYLEQIHGGNPQLSDTDSDGSSDYNEYVAGTLLDNANSIFKVNFNRTENEQHRISWQSVLNRIYTIDYKSSLNNSWQPYPFDLPGNNQEMSLLDNSNSDTMFYRVRVRMN